MEAAGLARLPTDNHTLKNHVITIPVGNNELTAHLERYMFNAFRQCLSSRLHFKDGKMWLHGRHLFLFVRMHKTTRATAIIKQLQTAVKEATPCHLHTGAPILLDDVIIIEAADGLMIRDTKMFKAYMESKLQECRHVLF